MAFVNRDKEVESLFKKCTDCEYGILRDDGYSNYTVEGTTFSCAKAMHPEAPFDQFYSKAKELYFAENCPSYSKGEALHIDVEEEALDNLSERHKHVLEVERTSKLIMQT